MPATEIGSEVTSSEITFDDIREAAARIQGIVKRTPVMRSRGFDAEAKITAFFKCENFQTGGAFKIRGASNFVFSIPKADLPRGVVAFSSGNHAQAVAIAARSLGIPATLVMPAFCRFSEVSTVTGEGVSRCSTTRSGTMPAVGTA